MDHKQAAEVLIKMLKKDISPDEREAVLTAVGVLAWTKLAQSRIKNKRDKK